MLSGFKALSFYKKIVILFGAFALLALFQLSSYYLLKKEYEVRKNNYLATLTDEWNEEYLSLRSYYRTITGTIIRGLNNDDKLKYILKKQIKPEIFVRLMMSFLLHIMR